MTVCALGLAVGVAAQSKLSDPASANEKAPATYKAKFDTSKGAFVITVHRDWAPRGADRFYNLVKNGFYDDVRFFRVIDGFMAQIGMNGNPEIQTAWDRSKLQDDPVKESNKKGFVTFASAGANTRTTQFFINLGDNARLDKPGACGAGCAFPPFGEVTSGMEVVDQIYSGYGEGAPRGRGPDQGRIRTEGNTYLKKDFPKLDFVKKATIEK
jgi:peptidyl-prolyl cis-trans isomerase A (cyclophilin A)